MTYFIIPHWWNLPVFLALIYLGLTRIQLESHNLYDTYSDGEFPVLSCEGVNTNADARTLDGLCNNLTVPGMGSVNTRFHRFVPINDTWSESGGTLYTPNPRLISQKILTRETFTPATSINMLAVAWIQFQTHDWFSHGAENDPDSEDMLIWDLPRDDPLRATGQTNMTLRRTVFQTHDGRPNTYTNTQTHWWDLSPIYGVDDATHIKLRSLVDGKMRVAEDGLLPRNEENGIDATGFSDDWWVGLSLMHNIWTKEHNAVADMFKHAYPSWKDQEIFDHARLVTCALNAKVHTVEWTPALLQDETLQIAMDANWYGLAPEWLRGFPNIFNQQIAQVWFGIMGGKPDFAGVPFAHSEEFVSVYRFHSLLLDAITVLNHTDGSSTGKSYDINEYTFSNAWDVVHDNDFSDLVFTFGADYPGALQLGNYPKAMQNLKKPGVSYALDMGAVDIIRDRERGVPRYNEFRRLFSLIPAKTMADISDNPATVAALRSVYGEDVESVDMLVGCLAESPRATGFAFSNTQFQAFILAASRRLMTDRFFTTDYTPAIYTQEGLDWIANSDFRQVIGRNMPELNASAHSVDNAFKPWVVPRTK
ncbi:unnamed protein product [Mycena citricolor]|uniref:Peroxidase n=1 Tax=Mycena citricolor TaxID=2018698 RepID=A0AAD2HPM7_9AGAR|nr:unnamed protein product [Mycena citricolor]CAK5278749.1 unnamed protein product [Mycena citricolor]